MNFEQALAEYAQAVAAMRQLQRQLTPGTPLGVRQAAAKAEREVDDLTALHTLPHHMPYLPPHPDDAPAPA